MLPQIRAINIYLFLMLTFSTSLFSYNTVTVQDFQDHIDITTFYGNFTITEPVLLDLLRCPMMERLKKIHQYGPFYYTVRPVAYTRYDHSIGVFALLRSINVSLDEQVAGLLHDISHTVFSHCGGLVFRSTILEADLQQDDDHLQFLKKSGIDTILRRHGFTSEQVHPKNSQFTALERNLPYLCADRIEYNLNGGYQENLLTKDDIQAILRHLCFENGIWIFDDAAMAKKFASISLWKTEHTWGSADNIMVYTWIGQALRQALSLGLISMDTILYGTDDEVWQLLHFSTDPMIQSLLHQSRNYAHQYEINTNRYDTILYAKFRGIDPMVKTDAGTRYLTELDGQFKEQYNKTKALMKAGWPIKFVS